MTEEIERIYVIPLKKIGVKSSTAAPTAVKRVKQYLTKHMKVMETDIWIDDSLNNALWSKGKYHLPTKIRVKAVKFDDGVVEAYLPETAFTKFRRELLKEEKGKKAPILRKEEEGEGEVGEEAGTEDYAIAPTADGDVKIKKKKAPKEKKETPTEEPPVKKEKQPPKPAVKKPTTKKTGKKTSATKTTKKSSTTKKAPAKKATKKTTTSTKKKSASKKKSD